MNELIELLPISNKLHFGGCKVENWYSWKNLTIIKTAYSDIARQQTTCHDAPGCLLQVSSIPSYQWNKDWRFDEFGGHEVCLRTLELVDLFAALDFSSPEDTMHGCTVFMIQWVLVEIMLRPMQNKEEIKLRN